MKIAVLKETAAGETRCAAIPETVKKFAALGAEVAIERGAGEHASVPDSEFEAAGAKVASRADVLKGAGVILCIQGPGELKGAEKDAILVGGLDPARRREAIEGYAKAGLEALAMEWMPRITRAQSMDILSSQSNLAGYKAVIDGAAAYGRAFPMMMTAAGTVSPAKVFVMGVGVAGLQAIATAKRLGAQVSATDVRSATREQILSLGAKPIFVENVAGIEGEGAGGYATEMSDEYRKAQAELVSGHIATMRPGSVLVDMAADAGGNVEGTVAGQSVEKHGVTIIGATNLARSLAADASALFARNLYNFLSAFWDKDRNAPVLPDDDEIVKAIRLTKDGKVVHERLTTA